jgi:two-component system LytT family response regulator
MKAIIIDDEPLAIQLIEEYLKECTDITVVATCHDGFDGLKAIQQWQPQLIFLDIQMPKISGFEMLELVENLPYVIFVTAFDQFAIQAFEANAVDYLLKPYSRERFLAAIKKVKNLYQLSIPQPLEKLTALHSLQNGFEQERIVVKDGQKIKIIAFSEVLYFEASDDYVKIVTKQGSYLKKKRMIDFENSLPPRQFVRCHRSFIVNTLVISRIDPAEKEGYLISISDKVKVPTSKAGYQKLREVLGI